MKKLLLIGDSIRLNYQPSVIRELNQKVAIFAPQDNARFAKYTLWYIREWLETYGKPDIVHWNNGMWDLYRFQGESECFTPISEYQNTLEKLCLIFKKSNIEIIFATTTPVADGNPNADNNTIDLYNKAAIEVMTQHNIYINNLNILLKEDIPRYIHEDKMHLSNDGIEVCADAVAKAVIGKI